MFITFCIIVASVMVGLLASMGNDAVVPPELQMVELVVTIVFVSEVVIKIVAQGFSPLKYFNDGWNRLDFIIVAGSFSGAGAIALLLRMVRLFRVLKMLKVVPQLKMLVVALVSSFDSINFVCILMLIFFYMAAITSIIFFQANDPFHW
jgi:voltage-gated sodium channel